MTNKQLAVCIHLYRELLVTVIQAMQAQTPGTPSKTILGEETTIWPEFETLWEIVEMMDYDIDVLGKGE